MIEPQLEKVIKYLIATEGMVAKGIFGPEQRPWVNFDTVQVAGKFEFAKIHKLFDREASNKEYGTLRTKKGAKVKDLQTAKISADYLAGFERDYRMRTRSRIRLFVHGGNRAAGNGKEVGPLRRNTTDWLVRILGEEKK
jgi:hypothetical protein